MNRDRSDDVLLPGSGSFAPSPSVPFHASFLERLPLAADRPFIAYGAATLISLFALWFRWEIEPYFPPGYPYLTFFPAVIISSFLFGPRPGILAALLCGIFAYLFFIPRPTSTLDVRTITTLLFYAGVVAVDIALVHLMQGSNRRLLQAREDVRHLAEERGQLAERSRVLFQEVQHRVGNNLQMVGAVLALQMRSLADPVARRAISDAAARLQVIGQIQRQLYNPDGELVPLGDFIRQVTEKVMATGARPDVAYSVTAEDGMVIGPESAVPIALILTEAIANALEHGVGARAGGRVLVDLYADDGHVILTVEDNGIGLPENFDPDSAESLGLRISRILSQQLEADHSLEALPGGTRMALRIPSARLPRAEG